MSNMEPIVDIHQPVQAPEPPPEPENPETEKEQVIEERVPEEHTEIQDDSLGHQVDIFA